MNDELKIIIKAILDENVEDSINKQIKSLNIDPISLDVKVNSNIKTAVSETKKEIDKINDIISRKVNKNPLAKKLRNTLKKEHINNKIHVVSSKEQPILKTTDHVGSISTVPHELIILILFLSAYLINSTLASKSSHASTI